MSTLTIDTVIKMIESLPESAQDKVVEHLREYIDDLQDEAKWDATFYKTQSQLVKIAKRAEIEINAGYSISFNGM